MRPPKWSWSLLYPQYWLLWVLLAFFYLCAHLPLMIQYALGRGIGQLLYLFGSARRKVAEINIQLCFPELNKRQQCLLVHKNMLSTGIGFMEQNMAWFMPRKKMQSLIQVEGLQHLQSLQGQGAIVVMRHTTTISLGVVAVTLFHAATGMYRRHKNPVIEYVQRRGRERMRADTVAFERKEIRAMLKFLRQGAMVIYSPDQDYGIKQGLWAKYFGIEAATVAATPRFAQMTKAKVIIMDFVRLCDNQGDKQGRKQGYKLSFSAPLDDFPSGNEL